jgi:hypothetical protein
MIVFLCACSAVKENALYTRSDNMNIIVGTGGLDEPLIPDDLTAARVAEAYFKTFWKDVEGAKPFDVALDSDKGIWRVSGKPQKGKGNIIIYLKQSTGEVLSLGYGAD